MLIHQDALALTSHNAEQVLALYRALADFVSNVATISDETKADLQAIEAWLFLAIRTGLGEPDMTNEECMRLALGISEEEEDKIVKFEREGLN